MCKTLFYKGINLPILLILGIQLYAQSFEQLRNTKSLDFVQLVEKDLCYPALKLSQELDFYEDGLISAIDIRKKELLSKLKVNNPEMLSELAAYDQSLFNDMNISNVLIAIVKKQSTQGTIPNGMNVIQYATSLGLGKEESIGLNFFYGYELFKQKKYNEALRVFEQTIAKKSKDSEHAHYYSAIAYLLISDYTNSISHFQKLSNNSIYKNYVPYYTSLCYYALGDFERIVNSYANLSQNHKIYNHNGLSVILAFSSFNLGNYSDVIRFLSHNQQPKDDQAILMLAISNNQLQQYEQTINITNTVRPSKNDINERLRFESAYAHAEIGQNDKALYTFNSLMSSHIDNDVLNWNIALLLHRKGDFKGALSYTKALLNSKLRAKAQTLLTILADELDDTMLIAGLANDINKGQNNIQPIVNNLFAKALLLIKEGSWEEASQSISVLKQLSPNSREFNQLQVLHGIKEYHDGDLLQAKLLLNSYTNSEFASELNEYSIKCYYYLGYTYFKQREPKKALGYFAKSLDLCKSMPSMMGYASYQEDLYGRIGDVHLLNNDLKNSAQAYKFIVDSRGDNIDYALFQLALIAELKGDNYEQIILLKELITNHPASKLRFKAEFNCANALFDLGKYAQAEEHYQKIIKLSPETRMRDLSVMQLGLINVNAGDYGKAATYYNQIIASTQDAKLIERAKEALKEIYSQYDINTEAYVALAISEKNDKTADQIIWELAIENVESGKYKIANDQLNKLIKEHPNSKYTPNAAYKIATNYLNSDDQMAAVSAFISAINTYPDKINRKEAYRKLGELLFNNKALHKEYLTYSELGWFDITPDEKAKDIYRRTQIQYNAGLYPEAIASIQKFDSANVPTAQKEEMAMKLLQDQLSSKDWNSIIELHNSLPDIKTPKWIYSVALAQMNKDQYDESISTITKSYETLLKDSAWLVKSMLLLSDIYYIQGDKTSAIAALESIINSELVIPPAIKKQVTDRLSDLNL